MTSSKVTAPSRSKVLSSGQAFAVRGVFDQAFADMSDQGLKGRAEFEAAVQTLPGFVFGLARTQDEHDPNGEMKPFPDWPYLVELVRVYETAVGRKLLVEKARQMMVSWLFLAVFVWELRHPNRRWGWISLKFDHADAALERAWKLITNLPGQPGVSATGRRTWRDAGGVLWERAEGYIRLPELHSVGMAMAQTADDARSHTFTGVINDEMAFQPLAKEGFSAMLPTIDSGRIVCITTPGPLGFVHNLYSGLDFTDEYGGAA